MEEPERRGVEKRGVVKAEKNSEELWVRTPLGLTSFPSATSSSPEPLGWT